VAFVWGQLPVRFDHVDLDAFVVMPNHIHAIFMLQRIHPISGRQANQTHCGDESGVRPKGSLPGTVGRIVQAFKSITTHEYIIGVKQHGWPPFPGKLWQKNYYEHIIRNENELNQIREYITNNPMKWACDRENRTQ
jgi:REP element-mobilizing transposase RayT